MDENLKNALNKIAAAKKANAEKLSLNGLALTEIPKEVFELANLRELYLRSNQLSSVPESITKLANLSILGLKGNPIEYPPLEVVNQGLAAIKEYFERQKTEGTSKIYEAKLLVVGAGGVGKTSLSEKIKDAIMY